MADAADVENALVAQTTAALYPMGTANGSVTGAIYRVYRGWPGNAALESDLGNAINHVSVVAIAGTDANVAQFPPAWVIDTQAKPGLAVSCSGNVVTFSGDAAPGQLAGILAGDTAFAYRTQPGDTPQAVAANLAALMTGQVFATVTDASVSVPGAARLIGRTVADQTALLPTRRQRQEFRLTCWCADPASRDAAAAAIDASLANQPFITLADGSAGRLRYVRSDVTDDLSTLPLYRRELTYGVEYATTVTQTQPSMLFGIFANDAAGTQNLS